jgi:hypothetical protein
VSCMCTVRLITQICRKSVVFFYFHLCLRIWNSSILLLTRFWSFFFLKCLGKWSLNVACDVLYLLFYPLCRCHAMDVTLYVFFEDAVVSGCTTTL